MYLLVLGIVAIIVGAALQFLRHSFTKQWIKSYLNLEADWWFDNISFYLIPILAGIGLTVLILTHHSRKVAEESLSETESLRGVAMLTPDGSRALEPQGGFRNPVSDHPITELRRKVYEWGTHGITMGGKRCHDVEYMAAIKELITLVRYDPYIRVLLTHCLKVKGDLSWRDEGKNTANHLKKFLKIQPHVKHLEAFYGVLANEFGVDIKIGGFSLNDDGSYTVDD